MTTSNTCIVCCRQFETRNCSTKMCSDTCRREKALRRVHKSKKQDRSNMRLSPESVAGPHPNGVPEIWREIADFSGYYVSDKGRVCDVDRITSNDKMHRGRVLRPASQPTGHKYVVFYGGHHRQVHRLVLEAFVGPCPQGCEGLHRDDTAYNNDLLNLRWGTRSENLHDAVRNGKKAIGVAIKHAKLNDDAVRFIRANPMFSLTSLGNRFGVHAQAIKQVREGTTWKHVI